MSTLTTTTSGLLLGLAASVAIVHTAIGVDHALPFVVLSRVQGWSFRRTMAITALCGLGHIASAVIIGLGAVALGVAVEQWVSLEEARGQLGLGLLTAFGLGYAALGAVRLWRRQPHSHADALDRRRLVTAWTLFVVLAFGPCEALVPLLLAPGVLHDYALLSSLIVVFGSLTVVTMLVLVAAGLLGTRLLRPERLLGPRLAGASDVFAGLAIAVTGVTVHALGL